MKSRIKRNDLEVFFKYAASISKSDIENPILGFIKIEVAGDNVEISKTNMQSFLVHSAISDSEDCSFLVDENILSNFVELSSGEYIYFSIDALRITIYDDRHTTESPTDRPIMFPSINKMHLGEWVELPKKIFTAIGICGKLVFDDEISGVRNSVFVGENHVSGSDATVGYLQKFEEELPKIVLRRKVAAEVCKLDGCMHAMNESFDLFKKGDTLFGFRKSEVKWYDLRPIFKEIDKPESFTIHKNALIKWNKYCINSCKSKVLISSWSADLIRLNLTLCDEKYEIVNKSYIDITNGTGTFKFNPIIINNLLEALPCDQVHFYPGENRYYITDEQKTFMSVITLIQ